MKSMNTTRIGNHLRVALKHSVLALAVAAGLGGGSVHAQVTRTYTDGQNDTTAYSTSAPNNPTTLSIDSGSAEQSGILSGTGGVIKSGAGQLMIQTNNTYSGGTTINNGILQWKFNTALDQFTAGLGTGPVILNSGTFHLWRVHAANALTINGGNLISNNGFGNVWDGPITLNADFNCNVQFNLECTNTVSGVGGLIKTGVNTLTLNGANTYDGPTTINAGVLIVKSSLYGNNASKWTAANITVANTASLVLNVGGAGEFTGAQAGTLFASLSTVSNNGLKDGSTIGYNTDNAGATVVTVSANLANSTGTGGGKVGLNKYGNGTLELTGANTYSGKTVIESLYEHNGTLKVSSFNSVNGGSPPRASSSLGRPTTVADGTIQIGKTTSAGTTLVYTGAGETTDRIIDFTGWYSALTFNQSGTGLLKFTSPIVHSNVTSEGNVINLQGSTAGRGEIGGAIPNTDLRIAKSGSGTWTLSGVNLYTGTTSINEGKLLVNGTNSGAGAVSVAGAAALGGTGTISSATTIANKGKLAFTLSTVAASHDKLDISSTLVFSGASVLEIAASGSPAPGLYTLVTASGGITGSAPVPNLPANWAATVSISGDRKSLLLNVTSTGNSYSAWAGTNAPGQTPGQDYDNDGVENGIEYFMGKTGSSFTALPGLDGTNKVTWTKGPAYLGAWQVQTSSDLSTWDNVAGTDNGTSVSYTLTPGEAKKFVRLLVTPTP